MSEEDFSAEELELLWSEGETAEMLLDSNQTGMLTTLEANWPRELVHVINMSRQIGKSYFLAWLCDTLCRKYPRFRIKYAAESAKQVRSIVRPHFADLFARGGCPIHLQPAFNTQDGEYRYPNGSTITISGADTEGDANKLLGQHADLFIVDEAGSLPTLHYVVKTIALPQTLNTGGRLLIVSTPAKTADHPFKEYCDAADAVGCLIERTIYDNPRLSQSVIETMCRNMGGEESTEWQREYLVKHVTDADLKIIKLATTVRIAQITMKAKPGDRSYRPRFFTPYVGLDVGFSPDFTGIVWGYLDHVKDLLVIEKDFMMKRMDTALLAEVIKLGEMELWGSTLRTLRYADTDERLITDFSMKHDLHVIRTQRDNKQGAVNNLNLIVGGKSHDVLIHPDCKLLLAQLETGVWEKKKAKFARNAKHGHYDVLDSAITLSRNIMWDATPSGMPVDPVPRNYLEVNPDAERARGVLETLRGALGFD